MSRSVVLVVNRDKREALAAVGEVRELITAHGRLAAELDTRGAGGSRLVADADLVVVLGGDGSLLSQARRFAGASAPMLGVNFGKLGFLAEFDLPAIRAQAAELFGRGPLATRSLSLLRAQVCQGGQDRPRFEGLGLNECVITAGPPFRMITLSLRIDGEAGPELSGDGLIVSTPIGSTAYNASAGGPIVAPDVDALVITPIAAHSLSFRPIVVSGTTGVEIQMGRVNDDGSGGGTTLVLDGQVSTTLRAGERVRVMRDADAVRFVRNRRRSHWATLIEKMGWASQPRGREHG